MAYLPTYLPVADLVYGRYFIHSSPVLLDYIAIFNNMRKAIR